LPRFHGTELHDGRRVSIGGLALLAGVAIRAVTQPLDPSPLRGALIVGSALLCLTGVLLAFSALAKSVRRGRSPREREPIVLPLTMALSLFGALLLNLVAAVHLASGAVMVPGALDEAIVHLELWGFASTMVLAVARQTWPNLLLLQPTRRELLWPSLGFWGIGSLGVPLAWLLVPESGGIRALAAAAQLAGAILYVVALRLFEPRARSALLPLLTDPPLVWLRVAFGFLLAGAAVNVVAASGELGSSETLVRLSAGRHALALGFLLPVIVFMAARILPGYANSMMAHPDRLGVLLWCLFTGALLRAGGELIGGYGAGWGLALAIGGTLSVAGFFAFAVPLWMAMRAELMPAR
jgi:hypothetical protein